MKLAIVAVLVVGMLVGRLLHRAWQARLQRPHESPRVPPDLLEGADRTWVVFTTPYCASCGPVKEQLAADDPGARIVTIDATREPNLAGDFAVRSAPTVLLADRGGEVRARLVGAQAVRDYLLRTA